MSEHPEPPAPPEGRLSCSSCGFTAPKSEYEHKHGNRCIPGLCLICVSIVAIIFLFILPRGG